MQPRRGTILLSIPWKSRVEACLGDVGIFQKTGTYSMDATLSSIESYQKRRPSLNRILSANRKGEKFQQVPFTTITIRCPEEKFIVRFARKVLVVGSNGCENFLKKTEEESVFLKDPQLLVL